MIERTVTVGEHHVNEKQAHVPGEVLDMLGVEPGDELEFSSLEQGCIIIPKADP